MTKTFDRYPAVWLFLGTLLVAATHVRFGLGALAWIAPLPWLRYLRLTHGWRSRATLSAVFAVAWTLAIAKILTGPMPLVMALLFSLPLAAFQLLPLLAWGGLRARLTPRTAPLLFASLAMAVDWAQYALTPFGTWGSPANTQLENLPFLQLASLVGMPGLTFVLAWVGALLEEALDQALGESPSVARRLAAAAAGLALSVHAFGHARLGYSDTVDAPTVLVAGVATDSDISGLPLPSRAQTARWDEGLLERTRRAAAAGAKLVVWPEAATLVRSEDEAEWTARLSDEVRRAGADVVAAYIVPISVEPLLYENKFVLVGADGAVLARYHKHRPVPGEPAKVHDEPMPLLETSYGRLSGAICYDYDFPRLARQHGRLDADLVALPSSDWRGIHPIHSQMAAVRAIEQGHSVLRSTRWGLSVGVDPYGRLRGWQSAFEPGNGVLWVSLPTRGVSTVYTRIGDAPVAVAAGLALLLAVRALGRRRLERREERPLPAPA